MKVNNVYVGWNYKNKWANRARERVCASAPHLTRQEKVRIINSFVYISWACVTMMSPKWPIEMLLLSLFRNQTHKKTATRIDTIWTCSGRRNSTNLKKKQLIFLCNPVDGKSRNTSRLTFIYIRKNWNSVSQSDGYISSAKLKMPQRNWHNEWIFAQCKWI